MPKKLKIIKSFEKETDMPLISLADLPFIEITGNNHIEVDGIKKIIESEQLLSEMSNYCRLKFENNFTMDIVSSMYLNLFNELIEREREI